MKRSDLPNLPKQPGVYTFKKSDKVLYVGKATSLKERVASYFNSDLISTRGPKLVAMLEEADHLEFTETDTVLEALLLESREIKKLQPIYNTRDKDDKSYLYVCVSGDKVPTVTIRRGSDLTKGEATDCRDIFGPFPQGKSLREAMKILRKIFPYFDNRSKKKYQEAFYKQVKLVPDDNSIGLSRYLFDLKHLKEFLQGKKKYVIKEIEKKMQSAVEGLRFEEAEYYRRQIYALSHLRDVSVIADDYKMTEQDWFRIEAFDVAHLAGGNDVGVMTVVQGGDSKKSEYRKFTIRQDKKGSDTHALREIITRRLGHPEWPTPHLIVADGAEAQKRTIERVLRQFNLEIPVIGVVKNEKHKPKAIIGRKALITKWKKEILLANNEAHRFAIQFHTKKRNKNFLPK